MASIFCLLMTIVAVAKADLWLFLGFALAFSFSVELICHRSKEGAGNWKKGVAPWQLPLPFFENKKPTGSLNFLLHAPPPCNKGDDEKYQENKEKYFRYTCCACSDTTKAKYSRDDRHDQEDDCPT